MAVYDLYRSTRGRSEAIKQGFSWPAFFFGGAWALNKKMYRLGLAIMGVALALTVIRIGLGGGLTTATDLLVELGYLGLSLWLGLKGNDMRRKSMAARGFRQVAAGGRAVKPHQVVEDFAPARQEHEPAAGTPGRNADPGQSLYDRVVRELAGNDYDLDLWSKVFAEMDGDRANTRAEYIKIRIEQLRRG